MRYSNGGINGVLSFLLRRQIQYSSPGKCDVEFV